MMEAPTPPLTLNLTIGADSDELLVRRLQDFASELERGIVKGPGMWGGAGTSGHYTIERRDVDPQIYREELAVWFQSYRSEATHD